MNKNTLYLLIAVLIAILLAYLFGPTLGVPEESHAALVAGVGSCGGLLLALAHRLFLRDSDGDGESDGRELMREMLADLRGASRRRIRAEERSGR